MKNKLFRILTLSLCVFMLMTSLSLFNVFAEETSAEGENDGSGDDEVTFKEIWDTLKPAYMSNGFKTVEDRIFALGDENIAPMKLYAVINGYAFFGDELTGEMIFLVLADKTLTLEKVSEAVNGVNKALPEYSAFYCTNPYNIGSSSPYSEDAEVISADVKAQLFSQVIISFNNIDDPDSTITYNSFTHSAAFNQINLENIRNGVRVEYSLGEEISKYLVPRVIRKEKLDAIYDEMVANNAGKTAETFKSYYQLKDINDKYLTKDGIEAILKEYPVAEQFAIYVTEGTGKESENDLTRKELAKLQNWIEEFAPSYTYEQLEADHAEAQYEAVDETPPVFKFALEYRVSGDEITIRCNAGNIRFDTSKYSLSNVKVLPYGGAGDVYNDGYIFSPDGSGSLISFKDLREDGSTQDIRSTLYGQDFAYHNPTGENLEVSRLPVFGVYQSVPEMVEGTIIDPETGEEKPAKLPLEIAYLAVIEEGDSLAQLNIDYGGNTHNFTSIYTSFNPRPKDSYKLNAGLSVNDNVTWYEESERKYTGNFTLRLFILTGKEDSDESSKSYSDMAAAYRKYLEGEGVLTKVEDLEEDIPLYLETIGALGVTKNFLGFPYESNIALTSFEDTREILDELHEVYEIDNVKVKMSGWYNGGMMGDIATSIKIEKCLGGEDGFKELLAYAKEHNVTLFPDIEFTFAYSDKTGDSFNSEDDCSQTINERTAKKKVYDPIMQGFVTAVPGEVMLSASYLKNLYGKAYNDYSKYEVGAISVGNLGKYLTSDFSKDNPLTREDSKVLTTKLLAEIKENNSKVMVSAGNGYTLPYVTDILDMPLDDSRLLVSYATVPFMSMVLHGYKEYTGIALNLAGDYEYQILKTIESGAAPYFVVAVENVAELKENSYSVLEEYYSVRYSTWVDDIAKAYDEINVAISDVQDALIVNHKILSDDGKVVYVEYDNGVCFYINYTSNEYKVEGSDIVVPAKGYIKNYANGEGK